MKIVKDINKLIVRKIVEIVFVLGFMFFSAFIWKNENVQNAFASMSTLSNLNYAYLNVEEPEKFYMFPMKDENALKNVLPYLVSVNNDTYSNEEYKLVLHILKESTLDYRYLKISINNAVLAIKDLKMQEDEKQFTFLLDENVVQGESKNYEIKIWLDASADNEMQNKDLMLNFDLDSKTTKM